MRGVSRWLGRPRSTWSRTSALARATEASMEPPQSARLGVEQQTNLAHAFLLQKLEHVHDILVAHAAIGRDHDRLIRVLHLPVADSSDQLVARDAYRGRCALLEQERLIGTHKNLEWLNGRGQLHADLRH